MQSRSSSVCPHDFLQLLYLANTVIEEQKLSDPGAGPNSASNHENLPSGTYLNDARHTLQHDVPGDLTIPTITTEPPRPLENVEPLVRRRTAGIDVV